MEDNTHSSGAGKAHISSTFEPGEGLQGWKNSRHNVSLIQESTKGTHSPSESNPSDGEIARGGRRSGKETSHDIRTLLNQVADDMASAASERRSKRQARLDALEMAGVPCTGNPRQWRQQFDELCSKGYTDINIGFWRCSTSAQLDHDGPASQCRDVVGHSAVLTERGVDMWVYDVDSGSEEARSGLDFLMEVMSSGRVSRITAQRLDRFARSNYLSEVLQREAKRNGVQLASAKETLPDGPLGVLMRQILQALGQFESALLSSRMSSGKRLRQQRLGTYTGGVTPYGYVAAGEGYLSICQPEARIIELIFLLYSCGYNQSSIATALNRWKIPTRTRGGQGWRQGQIRRILMAEAQYRGEALFSKVVDAVESIAHPPLLEHRPNIDDRTYMFGNVPQMMRVAVPDDLCLTVCPEPHAPFHMYRTLTREQALSLNTLYELRDRGLSYNKISKELNKRGLRTISGKTWKIRNVADHVARRHLYQAAIDAVGLEGPEVSRVLDPASHEQMCVDRIRTLKEQGLSIPKIRSQMIAEGLKTASGAEWSVSSVHRVLSGRQRNALAAAVST